MAARMRVHGKWKDVKIDPNAFIRKDFSGFVCMQELTEYDIVKNESKTAKKKQKAQRIPGTLQNPVDSQADIKKNKKRIKKKQKEHIDGDVSSPRKSEVSCVNDDETESAEGVKKSKRKKKNKDKRPNVVHDDDLDNGEEIKDSSTNCNQAPTKRKVSGTHSLGPAKKKKKHKEAKQPISFGAEQTVELPDMSLWKDLFVPDPVLKALAEQGFTAPTPIQTLALAPAIRDKRDIVGAAETGSGKTLAFGIPIIHRILQLKSELAEQVLSDSFHKEEDCSLSDGSSHSDAEEEDELEWEDCNDSESDELSDGKEQSPEDGEEFDITAEQLGLLDTAEPEQPLYALVLTPTRELAIQVRDHLVAVAKHSDIKVVAIVGGMAPQKQARLLKKCPEIVVATPGRLWELLQEGDPHLSKVTDLRFLVIDEADRMVEKGHFQELTQLLQIVNSDPEIKKKRQTFVFSATLTFVHAQPMRLKYKKKTVQMTEKQKLEILMEQIGVKDKPKVIDLTRTAGTAETLTEARLNCTVDEKDIYMYYFLQQYPGRTLVFANSKDCIRRLVSIFKLLQCCPLSLHADMHQRQRLKNLDRFKGNPRSLLLATDVAARGLDIPDVQHVIHYQVPRTTENYVHRSGRTARASKEGLSVMFVGPEDLQYYRKIIRSLNRDEDLPLFPVDQDFLTGAKLRVHLARTIDVDEHRMKKQYYQNSWFQKAAREMDIELDENQLLEDVGDEFEQSEKKHKLNGMKLELKSLLSERLLKRNYSGKYPTKSGKLIVPYLKDASHVTAISKAKAEQKKDKKLLSEIPTSKLKRKQKKIKKKKKH